ncbi:MAG: NAD(P)/FAD-dependent oxidoreductase [Rhodospirillales bacterium]|nr:NAD(P)/FAD-dependent oxidoreductase [Rhodospirillales bacterium]
MPDVVIVGAGPAGVRAAETLVDHGLRPIVIDEGSRSGGQIYRRSPPEIARPARTLYGFEARRATKLHAAFDRIVGRIDYRPETLVWAVHDKKLSLTSESGSAELTWDRLILATGAMDRVIPFPGWTLPGVYTLGGAQVALKAQACTIGRHVVFLGTGPLLYLVAQQYALAGATVEAVLDTSPAAAGRRALPGLISGGRTFLKGLWYLGRLRVHGIRLASGVQPSAAIRGPDGALSAVLWRDGRRREHCTECDALAIGMGLRSETQLADLCDLPFAFDARQRQWLPLQDSDGRSGVPGIYLAGDGAVIKGADAAELAGERAAYALLSDLGNQGCQAELKRLNRRLHRFERFRAALDEQAFPFPAHLAASAEDNLMVCRCEGISAGDIRHAACHLDATGINRAKAFTRVGMGRCQGRVCEAAAAEILADTLGVPVEEVGRMRKQAPIKPIPMAQLVREAGP